ncbi:MAG TPA: UDP-N-acetylmuramoyl-L-alanyl-D-glutamate--2,6-diaminopimelate ligase [Polyangiaceae bacterium]|jgi:UDP-N-acetylmuramoyl-L-alanyl-D-glutamate--2,6-diaminopimelate ligase|nr:MAG: UDP-N-acetylmuramoyl-L-alanyl-D-glutamate--LD-lysine ligase [Deltaproteobacteria bacterium ADurb.Bin207]HNZ23467.1 UDP-N-acetylmuramoyl-L-alanyl-D-glutamate--2,6-diaminopimelate ligase [Polyangiaceae bacterium]HOH01238.1 UDP-N-acetylmuramoyl-L-alanyl-D-glutamate--2,6-diaminopimelate ligase [Polyangiaceae bacterium]
MNHLEDFGILCGRLGLNRDALAGCTDLVVRADEVFPGACFLAVRGARFDGHDFIGEALARGARAVIHDAARLTPLPAPGVTFLPVADTRPLEAALASAFFGYPSHALRMTGVTGTNGKTTSSVLIAAVEHALGHRTAVVNTLGAHVDGHVTRFELALPPPARLQRFLRDRRDDGHGGVVLECSSWSLHLDRPAGVAFDRVLVTRLTRDHLDMHWDMQAYARAKWRLVEALGNSGKPQRHLSLAASFPAPGPVPHDVSCLRFGLVPDGADVWARDVSSSPAGTSFEVVWRGRPAGRLRTNLPGAHNVENLLGVVALYPDLLEVRAQGNKTVFDGDLFNRIHIDGRLEPVPHPGGVHVYVDYAHTPDALEAVLRTLRGLHGDRVVAVFGCGGERDREKRPMMGAIASRLAREVVLTSDNPRREDPEDIISQIFAGCDPGLARVHREPDRREAIRLALSRVTPGDALLVAGKGHETEQVFAGQSFPFDDRQVLREEIDRC